jgi:hypothetical protein
MRADNIALSSEESFEVMRSTIDALAAYPDRFEVLYDAVPRARKHWAPQSWEGYDGERFTPIEHLCHVRDIEIDGYHVRLRRALEESNPELESIDGYVLAEERAYGSTDEREAMARFRGARAETVSLVRSLTEAQLARPALFEGSALTVRGLVHYLCRHDYLHLAGLQWLLAKMDAERQRNG